MLPIAIFLLVLFAAAVGLAWLADNPGTVTVTWPWANAEVQLTLIQTLIGLAVIVLLGVLLWWVVSSILRGPDSFGRWRKGRKRDRGFDALSRGLIAAGSGNAPLARRLSKDASRYLDDEPLVSVLDAQTTLLEGDRMAARKIFSDMMDRDETRVLGLRGLYLEAEREGATEAAAQYALAANEDQPGTPWATQAVLKGQALAGDWDSALGTLQAARSTGAIPKADFDRKRAVLLTAKALAVETAKPSEARDTALKAHKLAPGLVPAATVIARTAARLGDVKRGSKVLETTWRENQHPDIANTYLHLRPGDSATDRIKRAEALNAKRGNTLEGRYMMANAALDAKDFARTRSVLETILADAPTERACLLMADLEEAERGDKGRMREWLGRAVHAPRDAAWTADGYVSDEWAPISPVTGEIDAFEWRVPTERVGGLAAPVDYAALANDLGPLDDDIPSVDAQVAANRKDDVDDAEIVPPTPREASAKPVQNSVLSTSQSPAKPEAPKTTEPSKPDATAGFTAPGTPAQPVAKAGSATPGTEQPKPAPAPVAPASPVAGGAVAAAASTIAVPPADVPADTETVIHRRAPGPKPARPLDADDDGMLDRSPDDPGIIRNGDSKSGFFGLGRKT